jgi:hypothetical protein
LIAKPGDQALAFLLFSFALDMMTLRPVYRGVPTHRSDGTWMYTIARQLVRAMAFHVDALMLKQGNLAKSSC